MVEYSAPDMMVVSASRSLWSDEVCFVGIGAPSEACNLARLSHAPDITLVYESRTIVTKPRRFPLSIGDGQGSSVSPSKPTHSENSFHTHQKHTLREHCI